MDEFELIRRYFDRRANVDGVRVGIGDDGAVLMPTPNCDQILVTDTLVSGTHFPPATDPADIGYRAVAVNLSDIAAMGGQPRWMTLALTLKDASEPWLESFATGLFAAADAHGVILVGGDTTRGTELVVTLSISAEVESGRALKRSGARPGDSIFVTGTLGDAAAGLNLIQRNADNAFLAERFLRPTPRLEAGRELIGKATAAIDISDGLAGDVRKLLSASDVGGEIDVDALPLSMALQSQFDHQQRRQLALSGGDDYELCFTAVAEAVSHMTAISRIGTVTDSAGISFVSQGNIVDVDDSGYRHFR